MVSNVQTRELIQDALKQKGKIGDSEVKKIIREEVEDSEY